MGARSVLLSMKRIEPQDKACFSMRVKAEVVFFFSCITKLLRSIRIGPGDWEQSHVDVEGAT